MSFKEQINKAKQTDLSGKAFLNEAESCAYTTLGRTKFREWAKKIGALRKIGHRNLYDREAMDAAIRRGDVV